MIDSDGQYRYYLYYFPILQEVGKRFTSRWLPSSNQDADPVSPEPGWEH